MNARIMRECEFSDSVVESGRPQRRSRLCNSAVSFLIISLDAPKMGILVRRGQEQCLL